MSSLDIDAILSELTGDEAPPEPVEEERPGEEGKTGRRHQGAGEEATGSSTGGGSGETEQARGGAARAPSGAGQEEAGGGSGGEEPAEEDIVVEEEEAPPPKIVVTIYGRKGTGKTALAMSFPGELCVLSFDRKATPVKHWFYGGDKRIHVFDVVKYMDYSDDKAIVESAARTLRYVYRVLEHCERKVKPHWIVFDGTEIYHQIIEWAVKHRLGLSAFKGMQWEGWKLRKAIMRDLHNRALNIARCGVIYTTFVDKDRLIVDGEVVNEKEVPKWVDIILYETDILLKTDYDPSARKFEVYVESSKIDRLVRSGTVYLVTDKRFWGDVVGASPCPTS